MMQFILAVTCFMPNATFVYNPITTIGILSATYLPKSNTKAYQICEKLNSRLARASVELADNQEPFSANFQFSHGSNIQIPITFATIEQQNAALLTAQSNFQIVMLDMDAQISQTLAYFSVQSYNANNCLKSVTNTIIGNIMTITADQSGCDYSITQNGSPDPSFTPEELNNTVLAKLNCQEMNIQIPVGIQFSTPSQSFKIVFNCDLANSPLFNRQTCLSIIKNFTFAPMTQSSIQLFYQLKNPKNEFFIVESPFDSITDPTYPDCFSDSSYQINGEMLIFYFTPSGLCSFNTTENQLVIGISDSQTLKLANQWIFTQNNYSFTSETVQISIECRQTEMENCGEMLTYLNQFGEIFMRVKFIIFGSGKLNFIVEYPRRYQECYEYAELTIWYKNGDRSGSLELRNRILGLRGCQFQFPVRMEIKLNFYEKTVANGLVTDVQEEPFLVLQERVVLSIQNETILFADFTDLKMLSQISSLMYNKKLYCIGYYDGLIVPVIKYYDYTHIYDNTYVYIITVVGGIVCGLGVAGLEILFMHRYK